MLLSNEPGVSTSPQGRPSPLSPPRAGQGGRGPKGRDLDPRDPFGASTAKQQGVRDRMMWKLPSTQQVLTKTLLPTQGHS